VGLVVGGGGRGVNQVCVRAGAQVNNTGEKEERLLLFCGGAFGSKANTS